MEVLLKKLDGQVSQQKYAVAKSKVALQDAEAEYQRAQAGCEGLLSDMQQLRRLNGAVSAAGRLEACPTVEQASSLLITVGCQKVSASDVRRALAYKLTSWKGACRDLQSSRAGSAAATACLRGFGTTVQRLAVSAAAARSAAGHIEGSVSFCLQRTGEGLYGDSGTPP